MFSIVFDWERGVFEHASCKRALLGIVCRRAVMFLADKWYCSALRSIDKDARSRFKAYRIEEKFEAVSNDRLRQLALIDSIKGYIDAEVYDELKAVCDAAICDGPAVVAACAEARQTAFIAAE